jgi:hypothetical protein
LHDDIHHQAGEPRFPELIARLDGIKKPPFPIKRFAETTNS